MEEDEFYVYPGIYYHCGACASSLSPYQSDRRPYKPKVCCFNPSCPKFLIVFTIGDEARVTVYDTGEKAEDPRNQVNIANAANLAVAATGEARVVAAAFAPGATPGAIIPTTLD